MNTKSPRVLLIAILAIGLGCSRRYVSHPPAEDRLLHELLVALDDTVKERYRHQSIRNIEVFRYDKSAKCSVLRSIWERYQIRPLGLHSLQSMMAVGCPVSSGFIDDKSVTPVL